jgi:hypothetical protein
MKEAKMECPVCKNTMVEKDFGGVMVDVCENGCKGIWFDWLELSKLDEADEGVGQALAEALMSERVKDEDRDRINCPKCHKPMAAHLYQSSKDVTVDECYLCGGFFLDAGELKVIKDSFMSEAERESFVEGLLDSVPAYDNAQEELEKTQQRNAAIKKMTRFLRPSAAVRKMVNKHQ